MKSFRRKKNSFLSLLIFLSQLFIAVAFPASRNPFGTVALDRFQSTCPADISCIAQFDAMLPNAETTSEDSVWVAVYRSNNNQPSVFVRDEFFHSMKEATMRQEFGVPSAPPISWADKLQTPLAAEKPVAVAQLRPSSDYENTFILDSLRCALKKENTDENCDGGSEFSEALSVAIDSLLLYHLKTDRYGAFDGGIRTKATLFSNRLIEERGFQPVDSLSKDMASHVSDLDRCIEKYAERSVETRLGPEAKDRALQIVSMLAQRSQVERATKDKESGSDDDDGFADPFAGFKMQI